MSTTSSHENSLRSRRLQKGWSQQQLADRAGLSRAGISAIEAGRLAPSVTAALAVSAALGCTVEELFRPLEAESAAIKWAIPPSRRPARYWQARVADQLLAYPVEDDSPQFDWHDGVAADDAGHAALTAIAERTLVVACCDPAAGLLAAEYARQFQFRMIVLRRSSRQALELLAAGKVHVAGLHLSGSARDGENARRARASLGPQCTVVRGARWDEGLAFNPRFGKATIESLVRSNLRWVGREEGSGARQCQDEVLGDRPAPRRMAFDHRSVVAAVKCGWADVGPCVRLSSEEAGMRFVAVKKKDYDLCFAAAVESDPRLAALVAALRSRQYRDRLTELPGYSTKQTGTIL